MRTSTSMGIATISLAAVLGGSLAIGSAVVASAKPTGSDDRGHPTVLHLTAETDQSADPNGGNPGPPPGPGDQIVSTDRISRFGKPVGRGGTVLTVVGATPTALTTQVVTTLDLHDGQIVLQGIGDGPTGPPTEPITFTLAVTGGTGTYQNARGFADIIDRPGGAETITISLRG
ncbi:MAG TPA: hypothetical protein VIU11_22915 [Nakamurella sp.]